MKSAWGWGCFAAVTACALWLRVDHGAFTTWTITPKTFTVPEGPADRTLWSIVQESNLSGVMWVPGVVPHDLRTHAIYGERDLNVALTKMLAGSHLTVTWVNSRTVALERDGPCSDPCVPESPILE